MKNHFLQNFTKIFLGGGERTLCAVMVLVEISILKSEISLHSTQVSLVITNAKDVLDLISNHTTIDLPCHTKEDIAAILENLPILSSRKGALKIH